MEDREARTSRLGRILVTGASGYVGGRLVPRLLARDYTVRAISRDVSRLAGRNWQGAELVEADALLPRTLPPALAGIDTAFYLIHSMAAGHQNFSDRDRHAAANFGSASKDAGVRNVIYLGGLGESSASLSAHLASRFEVSRILRSTGPCTTVLRAAVIIGAGSASFEILYHTAKAFRVFPAPRWATTRCQPIAIVDVLAYLIGVLETPQTWGGTYDIGGPEILTYEEMVKIMAAELGRPCTVIRAPFIPATLGAFGASVVSPVSYPIARALVESLRNEVVVRDETIRRLLPLPLVPFRQAVQRALSRMNDLAIETRWSGTPGPFRCQTYSGAVPPPGQGAVEFRDVRSQMIEVEPATLYRAVAQVGGDVGWYAGSWLWWLRGWLDRLVGGPGFRPGRRHPQDMQPGDTVNFWRVEAVEVPCHVLLRAEMRLPGTAWLEYRMEPEGQGLRLTQIATFHALGLAGKVYWYAIAPLHVYVFTGLLAGIAGAAREMHRGERLGRCSDGS